MPHLKKCLKYHNKALDLSAPKIMGVLNVTPDSFSFTTPDNALRHADEMRVHPPQCPKRGNRDRA